MEDREKRYFLEVKFAQANKYGEELCGDNVVVEEEGEERRIVVFSDGLGSGVKANILSVLTTKIIATMFREGCSAEEVLETLASTLPVREDKGLAYSTFTVLDFDLKNAFLRFFEFGNPPVLFFRGDRRVEVQKDLFKRISNMDVLTGEFFLEDGDWVLVVGDGVVYSGMGDVWDFGWGVEGVASFVINRLVLGFPPERMAQEVVERAKMYYKWRPKDDITAIAMLFREERRVVLMVGPPSDPSMDDEVVEKFLSYPGRKVICGGTTGGIVAKRLGREIEVDLTTMGTGVPPVGQLEGVDLLTEGVLTLGKAVELLKSGVSPSDLEGKRDGASLLLSELLRADRIKFLLGKAINPVHQNPNVPYYLGLKFKLVSDLVTLLRRIGKKVEYEEF